MSDERPVTEVLGLPVSIASSELEIMGVTLRVHVLDDGRRVLEAAGVEALFEAMGDGVDLDQNGVDRLAAFVAGRQ